MRSPTGGDGATARRWFVRTVGVGFLGITVGAVGMPVAAVLLIPAGASPSLQLTTAALYRGIDGSTVGPGLVGVLILGAMVFAGGFLIDRNRFEKAQLNRRRSSHAPPVERLQSQSYGAAAAVFALLLLLDLGLFVLGWGGVLPWLLVVAFPPALSVAYSVHRYRCFERSGGSPDRGSTASDSATGRSSGDSSGGSSSGRSVPSTSGSMSSSAADSGDRSGESSEELLPGSPTASTLAAGNLSTDFEEGGTKEDTVEGTNGTEGGASEENADEIIDDDLETAKVAIENARTARAKSDYDDALESCREAVEAIDGALDTAREDSTDRVSELERRRESARELGESIATERDADEAVRERLDEVDAEFERLEDAFEDGRAAEIADDVAALGGELEEIQTRIDEHDLRAVQQLTDQYHQRHLELQRYVESEIEATRSVPEEVPSPPRLSLSYDEISRGDVLGSGGNADVYRATADVDGGTLPLALKEPRLRGTLHEEAADRLLEEAETWRRLDDHDHVVTVVDYGAEPLPWIAMEYMDGGHLGERAGELSYQQSLWTALAITRGVRHAHDHGVAHLDLKPENVLFRSIEDAWDVPKVADWGLSKHLLEHSNSVEGLTVQYAAPEQFDPDTYGATDKVTDIYQLGAVFYELFTGRPPFEGTRASVIESAFNDTPTRPSELVDVPAELDEILLTALSTDREDRYEDVLYLRDDLEELFDAET